ncbi:MAG: molybdopterin molybdotransferase MoeA [Bacteroidales bacterium]|nr:molybdopterin molybdotransferase MoeA [Bacteroidales bacterium]
MTTPFRDVRMTGFGPRIPVADVLTLLHQRVQPLPTESVTLDQMSNRILAERVLAPVNVPAFAKSAMDGFAVHSADCPGTVHIIGESLPAQPFPRRIAPGEAVRIMTGAPIPAGAEGVVPVEQTERSGDQLTVRVPIPIGKHIIRVGEDVTQGTALFSPGWRLRPQDVGILAAIGVGTTTVIRRPRVAVLVTGNELLPPGEKPEGFHIVDSNSVMLAALITRDGGRPATIQRIPDQPETIRTALAQAEADLILVSGGTSVGTEDHAPRVLAELGELAVHGIAMRPAAPTGIGFLPDGRIVMLLPGNPVSCLCAYDLFAGRVIRRLGGQSWEWPFRSQVVPLASDVRSVVGRVDYLRVKVESGQAAVTAGGPSSLSSAVSADGFVLVDAHQELLPAGEMVTVYLYA